MKRILLALVLGTLSLQAQWVNGFFVGNNGTLSIPNIPWSKYTAISHFAAYVGVNGSNIGDGTVNMSNIPDTAALIAARPMGKKVLLVLKDNDSFHAAFGQSAAAGTRATFVTNITSAVVSNGYDGLELDWEASVNTSDYIALIAALRAAMPTKTIAIDVGDFSGLPTVANGAQANLDEVNVMCYDMDGASFPNNGECMGMNCTWFNDSLFQAGDVYKNTCAQRTGVITSAGVATGKIGIGIPYYGRRWVGATQPQVLGSFTTSTFFYRNIATDPTRWLPQYQQYDSTHIGQYLSILPLNEFDAYTGTRQIGDIVSWWRSQGFGGLFSFVLDYEYLSANTGDARYPLSTALYSALNNPGNTITVCASGCTTTSLQTALDSLANCGDTIQIKSTETQTGNFTITYRGCTLTSITVTSDRAAWLPPTGGRVSPSQLGNMARINTPNADPALKGMLDGSNRPPAGWNFVGVAFTTTTPAATFFVVGFNTAGEAANASQIADNITFDRCYFGNPTSAVVNGGPGIQDVVRFDVTNGTIKNSFFGDAFFNGFVESHGIRMLTSAGPMTFTNNFITTSSEPIFTGGATTSYAPAYMQNGLTAQYNYFWRPWKWNYDPLQPFAADYVTAAQNTLRTGPWSVNGLSNTGVLTVSAGPPFIAASLLTITGVGGCTIANAANWRVTQLSGTTFQLLNFPGCNSAYTSGGTINEYAITVCSKTLAEYKWGIGITHSYNAGENSWQQSSCGSQYNGYTDTTRTEWDSNLTKPQIGTFHMSDTTHVTWTGAYRIGNISSGAGSDFVGDLGFCGSLATTGTECHAIASFSGASLVLSTPMSAAPATLAMGWIVYTGSAKLQNVIATHNVFKNVDQGYTSLALSFANGVGDAGYGKTHTFSQNLIYANTSYLTGYKGFALSAGEADYAVNPSGYTWDHNTVYFPNGITNGSFVYANGTSCSGCANPALQPKFNTSAITNNLFGVSSAGGNGPFSGDGVNDTITTTNAYLLNSSVRNNAIPGGSQSGSASGGNTVSGNIYTAWADPFGGLASSGIFNVVPSSPYYHAGTDGASLGADFSALPLINNLAVLPSANAAVLAFDLSTANSAIKTTQPCVLEVSTSRNLQSDLGTYTVVASLDPTINLGADLSTQASVILSGLHTTWPVTGLASNTPYYGRLMCYGDTEWFNFTTPGTGGSKIKGKVKLTGAAVK